MRPDLDAAVGDHLQRQARGPSPVATAHGARLAENHGLLRGRLRIAAVTTSEYFVPDLIGPFAAARRFVAYLQDARSGALSSAPDDGIGKRRHAS